MQLQRSCCSESQRLRRRWWHCCLCSESQTLTLCCSENWSLTQSSSLRR
jgi:hypothetical protein